MRTLFILSALFFVTGCSSNDMCRSLVIGSDVSGLTKKRITSNSDPVFRAMMSRDDVGYGAGGPWVWSEGPATTAMCCATKAEGKPLDWCTTDELECTDPARQGLRVYVLSAPYSDDSRAPDDANYCYVAVKDDRIVAFWHRHWS